MKKDTPLSWLTAYYGLLQSTHLVALLRAGIILLRGGEMPFPAPPPPGGWSAQAISFLVGMGLVDGIAISLGLVFAYQALFRGQFIPRVGIISLTIAEASALIFAAGTFPGGAWATHPWAYGLMVVLFAPVLLLFIILLRAE